MSASIDVYRAFREANVSEENAQKAAQAIAPAAEGFARLEQLILTSEARLQNMITASETRLRTEIAASEARLRTDINAIDVKVARLSGEMVWMKWTLGALATAGLAAIGRYLFSN